MSQCKHASSSPDGSLDTDVSAKGVDAVRGISREVMLRRQADLVAVGEMPTPPELRGGELRLLIERVRQARRERLLDYISRIVATDIRREQQAGRKADSNA
jgi:hypothetical protein